jgi:hypothetical protein
MLTPQRILLKAAEIGSLPLIKKAIKLGASPKYDNSLPLIFAAHKGYFDCVEYLIPLSDVKAYSSEALRDAVISRYFEVVKLLAPLSNVKAKKSQALRRARFCGYTEIAEYLEQYYTKEELKEIESYGEFDPYEL